MIEDALQHFRIEARELAGQLESGLLSYENHPEILPELFRFAHTLKGGARVVRLEAIADLAHAMEDVLDHHRECGTQLAQQEVMELLGIVDAVRAQLASESKGLELGSAASGPDFQTLRIQLEEMDALAAGVHEAEALSAALRSELQALGTQHLNRDALELAERTLQGQRRIMALADSLELGLRQLDQQTKLLRLLDAALAFPELERAAHDAAVLTGKQVTFTARGNVKLDGHVLSPLRGALLHLVRNAVAHGIEPALTRRQGGKRDAGHVELLVERRGARFAFLAKDDGGGVDLQAVRNAAARRGLPTEGADGLDLMFQPGVSTAQEVSDLAGRGVGLDAVRATMRKLKGTVDVRSAPGEGSVFELVVPVSLSSMRALVIGVGGRRVLVPLDSVVSTVLLTPSNRAERSDGRVLLHEDRALPLYDLQAWLEPSGKRREAHIAVVVSTSHGHMALSANALAGTRDIIVRPLPSSVGGSKLVLGAAFDSHGDPELVLDPEGLGPSRHDEPRVDATAGAKHQRILVVDDSLTTRMLEQSILEAAGYEVDLASSAKEGLQKAMQGRYGLIITDVEMPGMDGYEFTAETRRRPELRAIPVIMVSSLASEESRRRGADAGISGYIVKGEFDQDAFLGVVREWLR